MPNRTAIPGPAPFPFALRDAILGWYASNARRLPFRSTTDPYAILVSEAMAQQTQAARAGEAWTRFMAAFPTPTALAAATPADVLRAWQGLGYNRRALSLWRAARRIVDVHGGRVPADLGALQALPGVGPYTARAVAAIAFGMPVGAVDTNVRRVLGRIVAMGTAPLNAAAMQGLADAAVPPDRPAAWTHALMDIGATICRPRMPACADCPARAWCRYASATEGKVVAGAGRVPASRHRDGRARDTPVPFASTTRWLRGRIVDLLRAATGDGWIVIEGSIGSHGNTAVASAIEALADEGLVELDGAHRGGNRRVRLPVA